MSLEARLTTTLRRPGLDPSDRLAILGLAAIVRPDLELLAAIAARAASLAVPLREVCLQSILFAGFPRALTALSAIADTLPVEADRSTTIGPASFAEGRIVFDTVYGSQSDKVLARMTALDPVFAALTIDTAYGRVLNRGDLTLQLRELMAVAALAVLGLEPQLVSHARGAVHAGATPDEVFESLASVEIVLPEVDVGVHERALRGFWDRTEESGG